MKTDMYRDVPEKFHERLLDTLKKLPEDSGEQASGKERAVRSRFSFRRAAVLALAAVLAAGAMTAGAVRLFRWNQQAEEHFGVEGALADKLTAQGVAVEETAVSGEGGITLEALQSVRTAGNYYFLIRATVPEGITVDGDTLFDSVELRSDKEFDGCVVNIVTGSIEGNTFLCEASLLTREDVNYDGGEAVLVLKDLIQTEKTLQVGDPLVEGSWELPVTLTAQEPDTRSYYAESYIQWGENHRVMLYGVEADSFGIRLIVDKEQAQHAGRYHSLTLSSVEYSDGTAVEEELVFLASGAGEDEDRLVLSVSFEELGTAIDTDKLARILIDGGAETISLSATVGSTTAGKDPGTEAVAAGFAWEDNPEDFTVLYARLGYALLTDGEQLYLWDADCGRVEDVLDLKQAGYEPESGELLAGVGGKIVYIIPGGDSGRMYLYQFEYSEEGEPVLIERPSEELSEEMKEIFRGYRTTVEEVLK